MMMMMMMMICLFLFMTYTRSFFDVHDMFVFVVFDNLVHRTQWMMKIMLLLMTDWLWWWWQGWYYRWSRWKSTKTREMCPVTEIAPLSLVRWGSPSSFLSSPSSLPYHRHYHHRHRARHDPPDHREGEPAKLTTERSPATARRVGVAVSVKTGG